jgi:hypothetical protein
MAIVEGGCLCGKTRYEISEAPRFAIKCFCTDCQKATGSSFAPQFAVGRSSVSLSGPLKTYSTTAQSGSDLAFGFCGDCGSPMTKSTSKAEELLFLYAGSLDDPALFPKPKSVYEVSRPDWDA